MPRRLSSAEKLARERQRLAKRIARETAKLAKEQERLVKQQARLKAQLARKRAREEAERQNLNRRGLRKITVLAGKAANIFQDLLPDDNPYWGKPECKLYNVPTLATVMAEARRVGKAKYEQRKREAKLLKRMHTLFPMVENAWFYGMDEEDVQWVGRAIGTIVFDVPARYIGWRSSEYDKAYTEAKKRGEAIHPSPEHIYPRQFCGELLVHHMIINEGITFEQFVSYVHVFRQIAHVMSSENHDMKTYQGRFTFVCPERAYELAGIQMINMGDGEKLLRLEHITPPEVLQIVFGERLEELHKYSS